MKAVSNSSTPGQIPSIADKIIAKSQWLKHHQKLNESSVSPLKLYPAQAVHFPEVRSDEQWIFAPWLRVSARIGVVDLLFNPPAGLEKSTVSLGTRSVKVLKQCKLQFDACHGLPVLVAIPRIHSFSRIVFEKLHFNYIYIYIYYTYIIRIHNTYIHISMSFFLGSFIVLVLITDVLSTIYWWHSN